MVGEPRKRRRKTKKKRKQRIRSPHPGVVLLERDLPGGGTAWRARFVDPDTDRLVYQGFARLGITSVEARRKWAIDKAESLQKRRAEIASGAPRRKETPLSTVITAYLKTCKSDLSINTVEAYDESLVFFSKWVAKNGPTFIEDLDRPRLARFREDFRAQRKSTPRRGKNRGRGRRKKTKATRAAATVNRHLRQVKVFLNHARVLGHLPRLDRDAITDALTSVKAPRPQPRPLSPVRCRRLLRAVIRHDRAKFDLTRKEHALHSTLKKVGETPRHQPIGPFVAFVLLTGCRLGEALQLTWDGVNLDAKDHFGKVVGEIMLMPTAVKTRIGRRIDLGVSPALRAILVEMKDRAAGRYVFGGVQPFEKWRVNNARHRLVKPPYNAPRFSWQRLRQTCGTFLTNAGGIFGAASIFRSAQQLGHSPMVAQRYYLDVVRGISSDAHTLEAAIGIEQQLSDITVQMTQRDPHDRGHAPEEE